MNIKKAIALNGLIFVVTTAGISPLVVAQDAGFYAGAAVGQARMQDACVGAPISCDDKDTAWKIFGGYQFNKNFGAEVGYVDFGKATANGVISGAVVAVEARATGWEFLGVGTLPITNNFSAYGKLGFLRWDVDASGFGAVPGFGRAVSISDSGTDITFGLGLKYDFTRNVGARLEWQRYNDVGNESTTGRSDVHLYSLGIVYKF